MSQQPEQPDQGRRNFLGGAAAAAGLAIAPGVTLYGMAHARSAEETVTDKVRWGMLVDTTQCADGCSDCVTACHEENGIGSEGRPSQDPQWIRTVTLRDKATQKEHHMPLMCVHCENPPCVDVCPTGASFKRADGIVLVDRHICIGCRYCMMACPFKARSFVHEVLTDQVPDVPRGKGCVESCTLCVHKIDRGEGNTACAEACEKAGHNAILFGDLRDPKSSISQRLTEISSRELRADLGLNAGVRFHGI